MQMDDKKVPKSSKTFYCNKCDYLTSRKSQFDRHIVTAKHMKNDAELQNDDDLAQKVQHYKCDCGKLYKYRQGLWKHKNDCFTKENVINNVNNENINDIKTLVLDIVKQNQDFQKEMNKQMLDFIKENMGINNSNNITHNSNNKSFNLNFFLNETCKNAMNIMDFANSIELNLSDLEKVGELGYVEGISKIIIDNLKLLDVTERPVHCSDFKRDVLYVKDQDKWEKDNIDNAKIKKVINCVTNKNISLIPKWKKENPDCIYSDSIKSTKINKIIMESMETDKSKEEKIIKNIAKEVTINKDL